MSGGTMAVSLALAAAAAIASHQGAKEQAKSQAAYQKAQADASNKAQMQSAQNAIKEQNEQTAAERIQQMQQNDSAAREMQKNQIELLQKKGTAMASSPYGSGVSFDSLMADYERAYAMNQDTVQEQLRMQGVAADTNIRGYHDRADSRINSQQGYISAPVNQPSALAAGLSFGSSATNSIYNHIKTSKV